ncbi:peptidylprolyl isomerase [Acinetobacter larvae]|uniref:Peptidyl-prolyl cis-trans isomerase n=1 Tax=Acinetobacter larvae TaxID=1789224 RepID=A0A1B2LYP6_9GAMM|nr:peptidylprolyl isomerase [Acinetobacter larvae]AOA58067.1 peptidylprolyl isomerase [Acinetobacter larvae]
MTDAIANNHVVSFHYTLTNAEGEVLDKSQGEPLPYLHGAGNIIPGLEKALEGKKVGDKFVVNVPAAEGYGEYNPDLVQEVPKNMFQGVDNIEAGMQFQAQTDDGVQIVTVKAVEGETILVDANFPLAGQDLTFDVEIVDIREASAEELEHGHVHGAGGHHH